jgi:hypothetical protein
VNGLTVRERNEPASNYKSFWLAGYSFRQKIDKALPFKPLKHPELEDVAINTLCHANCPYCYAAASNTGVNFGYICQKAVKVWGDLPLSKRPYQIAIGGAGEPTLHPDLIPFLKTIKGLQITPNLTTNGMHINSALLEAIKPFVGAIAVSAHNHLPWRDALRLVLASKIPASVHVVLGEPCSAEQVFSALKDFPSVDVVVLPYTARGRAAKIDVKPEWNAFFAQLKMYWCTPGNLCFGAGFFDYLSSPALAWLDVDKHEPEVFSGYRIMDSRYEQLCKSSYDPVERSVNGL